MMDTYNPSPCARRPTKFSYSALDVSALKALGSTDTQWGKETP